MSAALAALWLALLAAPVTVVLAPLAALTAATTAHMPTALGLPVVRELTVLTHAGGFACEIDTACTALVPAVLLGAALLASRRSWPARFAGVAAGVAGPVLINQLPSLQAGYLLRLVLSRCGVLDQTRISKWHCSPAWVLRPGCNVS